MPNFFDKSFKEQAETIIRTEDLGLLQAFIGVRNPIGFLQYYSSFIITKINIMNAELYGKYKLQERCLLYYRDGITKEDVKSSVASSTALLIADDKYSSFYSRLVSDSSKDIKEGLLVNLFLPISGKKDKEYDSICNADYFCSSQMDSSLMDYTRNTEVGKLCAVDTKQVIAMYNIFTNMSKNSVRDILEKYPHGSMDQRRRINEELDILKKNIIEQEEEIIKYKSSLGKIKDRSFLKEWYSELINRVKKEAKGKNNHVLYSSFPNDGKESQIFIETLKKQFMLEVISRFLKETVSSKSSKEQLICLRDIMMDNLVDSSKLHYKIFSERVKLALEEKFDEYDDSSREVFKLVINKIKPDKIMEIEQSVIDDMLLEAVRQNKQDSALLLICNGADIKLEREGIKIKEKLDQETLQKPGFLIIKKLYGNMPSIKASLRLNLDIQTLNEFVVEGYSQSMEFCEEFKVEDIFTLAEIRDVFPDNTMVKEAADSLVKCDKDKLIIKEQIMQKQKVLYELQKQFNSKKEEYTKPSWKWVALVPMVIIPWYSLAYAALYVGACLAYTAVDVGKPWNARRNAKNELEISQEDLGRAIEMFELFLECLQYSVVAGSDIFKEKRKEIETEIANIKKSEEKWVNLSRVLLAFENAQKVKVYDKSIACFNTESIKFNELAKSIIDNRKRYMCELSQSSQQSVIADQAIVVMNQSTIKEEERQKAKAEIKKERKGREKAEAKAEQAEAKAEQAEAKAEQAEAKVEKLASLLLQIKEGELPLSALEGVKLDAMAGPSHKK